MKKSALLFTTILHISSTFTVYAGHKDSTNFAPPLMGWSSWNTYRVNICEDVIKKQADAMVKKGLKDVGFMYINIDDGFFGWRDSTGRLHTHSERFPKGLKGTSDYIHSLGLKAGIYSDAGSNTCGSIWDNDANGIGVGLYGYEREDAKLFFKEWNFDFIKIDYCGAGQVLNLDEQKRYTEICNVIKEVGGKNKSINICRWAFPGTWAKGIASSWRVSADISHNWSAIKHNIDKNLYLSAYAGEGHYNDMDILEIGRGFSANEEEAHFGMWCIMSSPLLIGCDLTRIPDYSLQLLKNKELIALNQDPLGLQAYVVQHLNEGYVLVKDIQEKRGKVRAVAFYNPSDSICDFSIALNTLELGGKVKIRDLVKRKDLEAIKDSFVCQLQPRGIQILRMEAEQRLDPIHYEAEWAYLPCYNDLGKKEKEVAYIPRKDASGGMIVKYLGGRKENYAEWIAYSSKGGSYEMTISYVADKDRKLEIMINGTRTIIKNLNTNPDAGLVSVNIPVDLLSGNNVIQMGSPYCWAPDIDYFTLKYKPN